MSRDGLKFSGILERKNPLQIQLSAQICGKLNHICDRCGDDLVLNLDEKVDLILNKGIFSSEDKNLDLIEIFGDEIDLDEILTSETEAIKSDYFYCDKCKFSKGE